MSRKVVAIVLVVLAIMAMPAGAASADAYEDKMSGIAAQVDGIVGFSQPDNAVTYDGQLGFFLTYEDDDDLDKIVDWAESSEDRDVIEYNNDSDRVLLTAPTFSVYGGFGFVETEILGFETSRPTFGDGLIAEDYIETVDVNTRVEYVEPVQILHNESGYVKPANDAVVDGQFDPEGVAFGSDANVTNMTDAKTAVGMDNVTQTGSGITVAVIDTGANVGDGEIYGNGSSNSSIRITAAKNFVTNESVDTSVDNPDWSVIEDGNGHGSWVSSAVAANVTGTTHDGVAPDANLLIAKALDDEGAGETQDIAEAIDWSEDNGADIIVMSLGSPIYQATMADELQEAINGSVSVAVVAAGNSRETVRYVSSPSDSPVDGVVSVAATNSSENSSEVASAYFSSVGPDPSRDLSHGATAGQGPDVGAPGMKVSAAVLSSTNGIRQNRTNSGTSMAAPIVGGGYAVALEAHGDWVNETSVADWTENTSRPMKQAGTSEVGSGLLAVDNLVDKEETDETQEEVRIDAAQARDAANEAFGGNRAIVGASDAISSIRDRFGL